MNVVGYLRVSTDKQEEEGLGLEVQEQNLRKWCAENGHTLVELFVDAITGKKDQDERPSLAAALAAVADGVSGFVVPKLDRLARQLTIQESVLSVVWKHGGTVFSIDVGEVKRDDPDDPMRTFVRQVMGAAAQLEAGMIAARMRAGRRMKASKGGYAGFGSPRYGQRAEERELVVDDAEQATISRMAELRRSGRSLREIATTLTAEGHKPKRAERWHVEVVRRTLARLELDQEVAA